jgi:hypothetical protein
VVREHEYLAFGVAVPPPATRQMSQALAMAPLRRVDLPHEQSAAIGGTSSFAVRLAANGLGRARLRARHFAVAKRTDQFGLHHPRVPACGDEGSRVRGSDDEQDYDDDDDEDESGDGDRAGVHGSSKPAGGSSTEPYSVSLATPRGKPCRPAPVPGQPGRN